MVSSSCRFLLYSDIFFRRKERLVGNFNWKIYLKWSSLILEKLPLKKIVSSFQTFSAMFESFHVIFNVIGVCWWMVVDTQYLGVQGFEVLSILEIKNQSELFERALAPWFLMIRNVFVWTFFFVVPNYSLISRMNAE